MIIAINTRLLIPDKLEGIGWFEYETCRRITQSHPEHEFHFIFDRAVSNTLAFSENVVTHVLAPRARLPILYHLWYEIMLPRLLKKIQADVFISPDCHTSTRLQIPSLIVIHDINFVHRPQDIPKRFRNYLLKKTPQYIAYSTRIGTVSNFSKKDISDYYKVDPSKIDVFYNGVSESFKALSEEEKTKTKEGNADGEAYFLFVGSIHPRKNLQRLIPAFDLFKERTGSTFKLLVAGESFWMNKEIERSFGQSKNQKDIVFLGRQNATELSTLVGSAFALVYPSYFEGFGIPVLEGFKSHVPVITSNVTSLPEIAGDAALLVDPFSIESIASGLITLYEDNELRQSLIEKGARRAHDFSWDKTADAFWNSILKTISDGNA